MFEVIKRIFHRTIGGEIREILPIYQFGSVNRVYSVRCGQKAYVIRLNTEDKLRFEFPKEKWCLESAKGIGIPSPAVLAIGIFNQLSYMILEKVDGVNASTLADQSEQLKVWAVIGDYVRRFSAIPVHGFGDRLVDPENGRFSYSWTRHLSYNVDALDDADPLLRSEIITRKEQAYIRQELNALKDEPFRFGLVHGDLSLRNVLVSAGKVYLLDWGQGESHVYPQMELGILLNGGEIQEEELDHFLFGLGLSKKNFTAMLPLIRRLDLLKRLDKYRWAFDHQIPNISDYVKKLLKAINELEASEKE